VRATRCSVSMDEVEWQGLGALSGTNLTALSGRRDGRRRSEATNAEKELS
jgi:hypothetical protein